MIVKHYIPSYSVELNKDFDLSISNEIQYHIFISGIYDPSELKIYSLINFIQGKLMLQYNIVYI